MRVRLLSLPLCLVLPALLATAAEPEGAGHELLFKWINFILLFGALVYFARKPFRRYVAGRRRALQATIEESRRLRARAEQQVSQINQRLARLEEEVSALRRQAAADAAAEQRRIREAAEREAERIRATAQAEIASTLRAGRLELRAFAARLAVNLAEERIRRQLDPDTHAALFQAFVDNLDRH
ncbi:MAG: hypothetical protein HY653_02275 [Acidobacteria bacterium]|nr:hypothetical protein [Acidobacteriota bacterium]